MKTSNIQQGRAHPEAIIRGWVSAKRAGSTGITVGDGTTSGDGITNITVTGGGGSVTINPDGTAVIDIPGGGANGTPAWFNVKDYGAIGDGVTDDTSAINAAIAALITAGVGVLYFPSGTYLVSSGLTPITVPCLVLGEGGSGEGAAADALSTVKCTSGTANLFEVQSHNVSFHSIALNNTAGSVTAGSGIYVSDEGDWCHYTEVSVTGFYVNYEFACGGWWTMTDCFSRQSHLYGARIHNVDNEDQGDWSIVGSYFVDGLNSSTSAIRIEGAGGGKIANTKINSSTSVGFANGIDVALPTGVHTSVLVVAGNSIENLRGGHGIKITTTGTALFGLITITGNQFGLYTNNAGRAVYINAATNGAFLTNGSISGVVIDSCVMETDGTARAAIELVKSDRVTIGDIQLVGNFTSRYTSSSDTNTTDGATGSPTGAAGGDLSGTYPNPSVVDDSHSHTAATLPAATGASYLVISDTPSTPLVFADILQNEAQDDFIYSD